MPPGDPPATRHATCVLVGLYVIARLALYALFVWGSI
jgi:hypothetical protein